MQNLTRSDPQAPESTLHRRVDSESLHSLVPCPQRPSDLPSRTGRRDRLDFWKLCETKTTSIVTVSLEVQQLSLAEQGDARRKMLPLS